ncbi:MAG: hypothetical protein U0P30_10625 [Vicinamibacterales bacterium]
MPDALPREQRQELDRFPAVLRALIDAELAAGNTIVEIGHSHPAPPAGAYVKLARKVGTRPRASGDGLDFYERNGSLHSGEFTDDRRFFWVLEPPDPPPPEPDMDAIRRALEPKPDPLVQLAMREAGSLVADVPRQDEHASPSHASTRDRAVEAAVPRVGPEVVDGPTNRTFVLHIGEARPPHAIRAVCEREVMTRFVVDPRADRLTWHAEADVNGARWTLALTFDAALTDHNLYTLRGEASWAHLPAMHHDYERRSSTSWFALWTRAFGSIARPAGAPESSERYETLRAAALADDTRLESVAAVQRAIVDAMRRGGRYATSHKEGGTHITWQHDRFVRSDYGDDPALETFTDETAFLTMLWNFARWDATRHARDGRRPDLDTWILILRRMITD